MDADQYDSWKDLFDAGLNALTSDRLYDAERFLLLALRKLESTDQPELMMKILRQLAFVHEKLGSLEDAAEDLWGVLDLRIGLSGRESRETGLAMRSLADLYVKMERYDDAVFLLEECGKIFDAVMDLCIIDGADAEDVLADINEAIGQDDKANRYHRHASIQRNAVLQAEGRPPWESTIRYLEAMVKLAEDFEQGLEITDTDSD